METGTVQTSEAGIQELLQKLWEDAEKQHRDMERQLQLMRVIAAAAVGMLLVAVAAACLLLPQIRTLAVSANEVISKADRLTSNFEAVSQQLVDSDISGMLEEVKGLIGQTESGVTEALTGVQETLEKIQELDMDTLNQSIADLNAVVGPLRQMFGR